MTTAYGLISYKLWPRGGAGEVDSGIRSTRRRDIAGGQSSGSIFQVVVGLLVLTVGLLMVLMVLMVHSGFSMARYSIAVLKVPLNTNRPTPVKAQVRGQVYM